MAVRATVNQVVQVGVESTHGTPVAASKLLEAWLWTFGDKPATKQFTATGRKYPAASELLTEFSQGKVSGQGDYNAGIYALSSLFGTPTPQLHGASTTAYDWKFSPLLSGVYAPTSFTVQNGDGTDAEQYAYLLFTGFGYSFDRKQEFQVSGDWFSQTFTDSVALTASPTPVAVSPITGAQANVYLDTTSAGIGTTLITQDVMKVDYKASNYYGQFWPVNRANASFTSHLDLMPKNELKITFHASTAAIAYIGTYLRTGAKGYLRVDAQGPVIDGPHSVNAEFKHDLACFMTDVADLSDVDGVYAYETTWQVCEDTAWTGGNTSGTSQIFTYTNLLSTL